MRLHRFDDGQDVQIEGWPGSASHTEGFGHQEGVEEEDLLLDPSEGMDLSTTELLAYFAMTLGNVLEYCSLPASTLT